MKLTFILFVISFSISTYGKTFVTKNTCAGKTEEMLVSKDTKECSLRIKCIRYQADVFLACKKMIYHRFIHVNDMAPDTEEITSVKYDSSNVLYLTTFNQSKKLSRVIKGMAGPSSSEEILLKSNEGLYTFEDNGDLVLQSKVKCSKSEAKKKECFESKVVPLP